MEEIHAECGEHGVQGYESFWTRDGRRFAPYTDDTQMSEAVTHMAFGFVRWLAFPQGGHREPGDACQSGAELLERATTVGEST